MRLVGRQLLNICTPLLTLGVVISTSSASPEWWDESSTRIVEENGDEDNYAPANLGQLKHVAVQASKHLDDHLSGGSGPAIQAMIAGFEPRSGQGYSPEQIQEFLDANYSPINLGQLKAVAKPFYDRLLAAGYDTKQNLIDHGYPINWAFDYPWDPATPVETNYAPANIGQLKIVFSFDLAGFSEEPGNPPVDLPEGWDDWIAIYFPGVPNVDPNADPDGDGLSNLEEFYRGRSPVAGVIVGGTNLKVFTPLN